MCMGVCVSVCAACVVLKPKSILPLINICVCVARCCCSPVEANVADFVNMLSLIVAVASTDRWGASVVYYALCNQFVA